MWNGFTNYGRPPRKKRRLDPDIVEIDDTVPEPLVPQFPPAGVQGGNPVMDTVNGRRRSGDKQGEVGRLSRPP
ncbi:hypothetical protein R1flu_001733 [Riccia fluitans]|uniref:Uncharacterized protein n=1 Tax=Riccia fluitans TaxID=41844 RepID=A0ABD1Y4C3_9MARC